MIMFDSIVVLLLLLLLVVGLVVQVVTRGHNQNVTDIIGLIKTDIINILKKSTI